MAPTTHEREQMRKLESVPQGLDLGLMPMTFLYPTTDKAKQVSWFKDWRGRAKMEWWRIRGYWYMLLGWAAFKRMGAKKLYLLRHTGKHKEVAERLYRDMYTALAENDTTYLEVICCEGLLESLRNRLRKRSRDEVVRWEYERAAKPRIVSHRAQPFDKRMAGGQDVGIRQVIVRLTSYQRIITRKRNDPEPDAEEIGHGGSVASQYRAGLGGWKKVTEHAVIQRRFVAGTEDAWMLWGLVEENDSKDVLKLEEVEKVSGGLTQSNVPV